MISLRLLVTAVVAWVGLAVTPASAMALTPDQIGTFLRQAHPDCGVSTKVLGSGLVKGAPMPLYLVNLSLESCGGGNFVSSELVGIYQRGARIAAANAPINLGAPDSAVITDGRVVVSTLSMAPHDPLCCPTLRRTARLVFVNGVLVEER